MAAILTLENLNYGYIDGGYKREILKNLSYSFEEGTFYTILEEKKYIFNYLLNTLAM